MPPRRGAATDVGGGDVVDRVAVMQPPRERSVPCSQGSDVGSVNARHRRWTVCPLDCERRPTMLRMLPIGIAELDARLILTPAAHPRAGIMDLARRLSVARGTVQARLDKLQARGVV